MKKLQPIIRLSVLLFLVFGIFQTTFGQSIDSMSKVILDKVEKQYASYETMRYDLILKMEDEFDTSYISLNKTIMKIVGNDGTMITDGKIIFYFSENDDYKQPDNFEEHNYLYLYWLGKQMLFFLNNDNVQVTYLENIDEEAKNIHILNLTSSKNDKFLLQIKVDSTSNHILEFLGNDENTSVFIKFINFEANPTFPDDYFEIKE